MAEASGNGFQFPSDRTPTPYLAFVLMGSVYVIPSDHLKTFRLECTGGASLNAVIELYDSFEAGRGASHIDSNLLTLFGVAMSKTEDQDTYIAFGWNGGVINKYLVKPAGLDYTVDDIGLTATIKMIPIAQGAKFFQGQFPSEVKKGGNSPLEVLKEIIKEYNKVAEKDAETKKAVNVQKINEAILIDAEEFNGKMKIVKFSCAGMTLDAAIQKLISEYIPPAEGQPIKVFTVEFTASKGGIGWDIVIRGFSPENKARIKRSYRIRTGGTSNVVNISWKNNGDMMMYFSRVLDCFITAVKVDPKKDKMESVKTPDGDKLCEQSKEAMRKAQGVSRPEGSVAAGPTKKVVVNLADKDFGNASDAGRAVMRAVYAYWSIMSFPTVEIKVPGDPNLIYGSSTPDSPFVGIGDNVSIVVNNPNGQPNSMLCGRYQVNGFYHDMSSGEFFTTIKAMRTGPL